MTDLTTYNVNPLTWIPGVHWHNHRKPHVHDKLFLGAPVNRLHPFQFSIADTEGGIVNWTLYKLDGSQYWDIKTMMQATGLSSIVQDGREIVIYPGSVDLPGFSGEEGQYYLRAETGNGDFLYTELFSWAKNIHVNRNFIKVEWWHNEDFIYPGGLIRYEKPFKMWVYFRADIGKPARMTEEHVEKRDGREFPLKQISWKVFKFAVTLYETVIDALALVWQHDNVRVYHMDRVYDVEKFTTEEKWNEEGDFATLSVEFRTDTVTVVSGRTIETTEQEGACLVPDFQPIAWIKEGTPEHSGRYWTDEFGANHSFDNGQMLIIQTGGFNNFLRIYNGLSGNYDPVTTTVGETVYTVHDSRNPFLRKDNYFFASSIGLKQRPVILTTSNLNSVFTVTGETYNDSLIEVWLRYDYGDVLLATFTSADFMGAGITFDVNGANAFFLRARTYICEEMGDSDAEALEGIDYDVMEDTHIVYPDLTPESQNDGFTG